MQPHPPTAAPFPYTTLFRSLRANRTREEREHYLAARAHLTQHLVPPRRPDEEITDVHRDVAAALQACLDRTMLHLCGHLDRKSTRLNSSHLGISYAVFCLKK